MAFHEVLGLRPRCRAERSCPPVETIGTSSLLPLIMQPAAPRFSTSAQCRSPSSCPHGVVLLQQLLHLRYARPVLPQEISHSKQAKAPQPPPSALPENTRVKFLYFPRNFFFPASSKSRPARTGHCSTLPFRVEHQRQSLNTTGPHTLYIYLHITHVRQGHARGG
jgi:hypothetical protein